MSARRRRPGLAAAVVLLVAACGGSATSRTHARDTSARSSELVDARAACVPAPMHTGAPPAWTAAAFSDSSPGFRVPYALASGDTAAAFFFAPKLRAGHPSNPANKVLWIVRLPRNGHPLLITARLSTDPSQLVRIRRPADSSPGEIYPSYVDLPNPGCWELQLAWGRHRARVDLQVQPAR
jgi:hypothetical protein